METSSFPNSLEYLTIEERGALYMALIYQKNRCKQDLETIRAYPAVQGWLGNEKMIQKRLKDTEALLSRLAIQRACENGC